MPAAYARLAAIISAALLASPAAMAASEDVGPQAAATYYQRVDAAACASGKCTATFPAVPAGTTLQTTNVSCVASGPLNGLPAYATVQSGAAVLSFIPLSPYTSNGTDGIATGVLTGGVFVAAGKAPSVVIVGSSKTASCTVSGRLTAN